MPYSLSFSLYLLTDPHPSGVGGWWGQLSRWSAPLLVRRSRVRFPLWPPAPYRLGRCQYNVTGRDRSHGLRALSLVWQHIKLSDVCLATRPRYSLVADQDVKKPTNQPNKSHPSFLKLPPLPVFTEIHL